MALELLEAEWSRESPRSEGERVEALQQCLGALPEESRHMLHLRYFQERSCAAARLSRRSSLG